MFISILINSEYWDYASRSKWYLKNLVHCKENKWIMITHEYLGKHFEELQQDINERFFREFEMRPFSANDINEVEQYFIPDAIFDKKEQNEGSRTQTLISLTDNSFPEVETELTRIIEDIQLKHPNDKIEGIFNCLENFQFLRNISSKFHIPLISYSFSAIRKPHGYKQTLYHTNRNGYLYTSAECQERFEKYQLEDHDNIPIFSHEEIIALLGKDRTLPLIPLLDAEPQYEIGICGESFSVLPQFFNRNKYTDDDIFYECNKIYKKEQIVVRSHAAQLDMLKIDRSNVHNDPAPFLLSCKRFAAVRSQIMLKALLWKRSAIVIKDTLGFGFLCNKNYKAIETVDIEGLNYYVFGYLVPSALMFSDEYWKWRLTNPSETDIYMKHLQFLSKELNVSYSIMCNCSKEERLKKILKSRCCDDHLISHIIADIKEKDIKVNYDDAVSKFVIHSITNKTYWRLNTIKDNHLYVKLEVDLDCIHSFDFYPFDDVAGGCKLVKITINGVEIKKYKDNSFRFLHKGKGFYNITLNKFDKVNVIECEWLYMSFNEYFKRL